MWNKGKKTGVLGILRRLFCSELSSGLAGNRSKRTPSITLRLEELEPRVVLATWLPMGPSPQAEKRREKGSG
jgi:hypothetical protein